MDDKQLEKKEDYIAGQKEKQTNGAFMIETFKIYWSLKIN